jgi:hypothetical protein
MFNPLSDNRSTSAFVASEGHLDSLLENSNMAFCRGEISAACPEDNMLSMTASSLVSWLDRFEWAAAQ